MNREIRLYNLILPVWLLWLLPQTWLAVLPGNLAVDCLVLYGALSLLHRTDKGALFRPLWWRFWLLGFAADFLGVLWLLLAFFTAMGDNFWANAMEFVMHDPFGHPLAFFWTLAAIAIAGVFVYRFDLACMKRHCPALSQAEQRKVALAMAVVTAPWTFLIPVY
jgi:hypothetical protein